jgi:hypothetical protein
VSEEPRERIIEVALQELLRDGERPDYASRVRQRWEAQRERKGGRGKTPLGRRPRRSEERGTHAEAPPPRAPWYVRAGRLAAAAAVVLGATLAWRAWQDAAPGTTPGSTPSTPATDLATALTRELAPGLTALPAAFGEVIVNPTDSTLELTLAGGERIELGPLAVLALESAPESDGVRSRATPRLLDGAALFEAPAVAALDLDDPYRYGLGNSPAALVLDAGGRFRAELARASGPHPLDVSGDVSGTAASTGAALRSFGRGQLLGPTWLTLQPLVGALTWLDTEGNPRVIDKPFEAVVVDERGTARPFASERRGLLDKLVAVIAPVPGVEPLPERVPFGTWQAESRERELTALLEATPALWVPAARELERRLASHTEAYWWRGAHAVVARAGSEAALRVARRWWRDGAERFDTDALLALAEAGHQPFVRELEALLEGDLPLLDETEASRRLRRGGPDSDVDLLVLAALAQGDQRRTGRALDLTPPLVAAVSKGELDTVAARALLAAATLARAGLDEPWVAARAELVEHVTLLANEDEYMPASLLAAYLDVAAESLGLAPYAAADPALHAPRLAYFDLRARARSMVLRGELPPVANMPATLDEWLETWRAR